MKRMAELARQFGPRVSGEAYPNASIYGTVLCDNQDAAWPIHRDGTQCGCEVKWGNRAEALALGAGLLGLSSVGS